MKRLREDEPTQLVELINDYFPTIIREEPINYFFPVLILQPDILYFIFECLDETLDLLNIYKVLYQYFYNYNNEIITFMNNYLQKHYFVEKLSKLLLKTKVNKLQFLVNNGDIEEYLDKLKKYKKFRDLKNFVKYGLCDSCEGFPEEFAEFINVYNRNYIELECKSVYLCKKCSNSKKKLSYNGDKFRKKIGIGEITEYYANKHGIRYEYVEGCHKFYRSDVENRYERREMVKQNRIQYEKGFMIKKDL